MFGQVEESVRSWTRAYNNAGAAADIPYKQTEGLDLMIITFVW